jgi:hypothetical protein
MRATLQVLLACSSVALAVSCDTSRGVAPSQRTIGPAANLTVAPQGDCPNDSKLLNSGPTSVYGEGNGTWWGLVINGLNAAGFTTDAQKITYLNHVFGTSFDNLDQLKVYNLSLVADWDKNQNGYVCAYELRGTRAYLDDPFINLTFFGISDDKLRK